MAYLSVLGAKFPGEFIIVSLKAKAEFIIDHLQIWGAAFLPGGGGSLCEAVVIKMAVSL